MLRKLKTKQKTVADKVAALISHPNQSDSDSGSEDESTAPKVVDFDEEYQLPDDGTSEFRKRNVKLLSEQSSKYKGKIASRKDFEEESDDEVDNEEAMYEESDEEEEEEGDINEAEPASDDSDYNEESFKAFDKALKKSFTEYEPDDDDVKSGVESGEQSDDEVDEEDDDDEADDDDDDDEADDDDEEDDDENEENATEDEETAVISKVNRDAEIQKGLCVQNQLHLWERLLELRINSQKILTKTNQLPAPTELTNLKSSNEKYETIAKETTKQTQLLLKNLLSLQDSLYGQYSELNKTIKPTLKRPSPFKGNHAEEPPLKQIGLYLQERFDSFQIYRNTVLLKWDDRTKLLQPGAGAKKRTLNEEYDIIKKIDNTLMNKSSIIQKSQQLKSNQQPKTENVEEEVNAENLNTNIYDDSDFYHQQLRELIEYKANTSNNMSEVTKQFLELQKLRQKMKKKVDTRASKGRKLRYVVHNKLLNFMAPHDNTTWTNDSKDELSKSLFV